MTPKEALQYAKGGLEVYQRDYPELITQIEFQKLVIKALEKLIPKKPNGTDRAYTMHCPNCSAVVMRNLSTEQTDYCIRCGQAIDWTEDNE